MNDTDRTESIRRELLESGAMTEALQAALDAGEPVYDTAQLQAEFAVEGFMAPFVVATRRSDRVRGSLQFTARPRYYFGFVAN